MDSMIHIGPVLDKQSMANLTEAIVKVLQTASKERIDEASTRAALEVITQCTQVKGAAVSGCILKNKELPDDD